MKRTFIRCNADHSTGYGHVSRCLSLALALRKRNFICCFLLGSQDAQASVKLQGFPCKILPDGDPEGSILSEIMMTERPDVLVLDVRPQFSVELMLRIKGTCGLVAVIDDMSPGAMLADALYLPPHPAAMQAEFFGFRGIVRRGFPWVILGNGLDLADLPPAQRPFKNILMCMGGSDPWGFTKKLAPIASEACSREGQSLGVVIGPGFSEREQLMEELTALGVTIFDAPQDMGRVYTWADAAISTVCVGAYELAAARRLSLYVCPDADYAEHAKAFESEDLGICIAEQPGEIGPLLRRLQLLPHARIKVDSCGADRIADDINSLVRHVG